MSVCLSRLVCCLCVSLLLYVCHSSMCVLCHCFSSLSLITLTHLTMSLLLYVCHSSLCVSSLCVLVCLCLVSYVTDDLIRVLTIPTRSGSNDNHLLPNDNRSLPNDQSFVSERPIVCYRTIADGGSLAMLRNDYEKAPGLGLPSDPPKAKIVNVSFLIVSP